MLRAKTWCVIGDVLNTSKAASRVVTHLERHGKTVYCVNPSTKTVETETLKRSLSALPAVPDVIDLIINPAVGAEQMRAAAELGISNVYVQPVRASRVCAHCQDSLSVASLASSTAQLGSQPGCCHLCHWQSQPDPSACIH